MDLLSIKTSIPLPSTHLIAFKRPKEIMNRMQESTWYYTNNNHNRHPHRSKFNEEGKNKTTLLPSIYH